MSSYKGLHPVYAALESHQYTRAIKLCQQQPATNTLAVALLAHAYAKSGQRFKALVTIQSIFGSDTTVFPELQLEIQYAAVLEDGGEQPTSRTLPPAPSQQATKKLTNAKKGKKKQSQPQSQPVPLKISTSSTLVPEDWDLIDQLETPPTLPADWEQRLPPPNGAVQPDATLLATLSMTMLSWLKLPLTAYQLYCWAVTTTAAAGNGDDVLLYTDKAYLNGLTLLLAPQYASIHATILAHLQVLALQVTRLHPTATLWAAQTALWQLTFLTSNHNDNDDNNNTPDDAKQQQRLAMLPRLAESLASKCVEEYCNPATNNSAGTDDDNSSSSLLSTESFLLYMRTLDLQSKWTEKLAALDERLQTDKAGKQMSPPRQTILELKIQTLQKLEGRTTEIRETVEELLAMYPDDWEYWKQHLESSIAETGGDVERGCVVTEDLIIKIIQDKSGGYPLRGPNLMFVELAATRMKTTNSEAAMSALMANIVRYGNDFSSRASCIFSDLCPYLEVCLESCNVDQARSLLQWSKELRRDVPTSDDPKVRRDQLRVYIFAVQVNYKVLFKHTELRDEELPSWQELVEVWKSYRSFENAENVDQAQKESRPADELILLAVQRLLCTQPGTLDRSIAACLLESAMQYSPYNADLKICAMFVYSDLHAASRSWGLYHELYIKHIQNESCAYLILPLLRSGGLYRETIMVCQEIIGLQRTSGREAADFTARAMESGAVSKAEEFLVFHRERMTKSLTTLEAKGLILDAAPMLVQENEGVLGSAHGIVGGEADLERAKQMVAEAHNANGAFSLLQLRGPVEAHLKQVSENRDFGVLSYEILIKREFDTPNQILSQSIRRCHQHSLLLRAALCIDAAKGPKKGKATKTSPELDKRCKSLLKSVDYAAESVDFQPAGCVKLLQAMREMCLAIVALSAGISSEGEPIFDNLDSREEVVVVALTSACESVHAAQREILNTNDLTVSRASRLLPDSIAPLFALFQMCAKLTDLFGWGRRKRKTKRCAAAVAAFALSFASLVGDMKSCLDGFPSEVSLADPDVADKLPNIVELAMFKETCDVVFESQMCTRGRVETILDYVQGCMDAFDVDE